MIPKIKKDREMIMIAFSNQQHFLSGAMDVEGTDFIYGSLHLLQPSNADKLKKFQTDTQQFLEMLILGLKGMQATEKMKSLTN